MPKRDFEQTMSEWYREETVERAPDRLAEKVSGIPDIEPESTSASQRWRRWLGRWSGNPASDHRRNRFMLSTAAALTAAIALVLGAVVFDGGRTSDDTSPAEQIFDAEFDTENPPSLDDFMGGIPVWVDQCDLREVRDGDFWENEQDLPHPDGGDTYAGPGQLEIGRGNATVADWEAQDPGSGIADPRLTGLYSEVVNTNTGAGGTVSIATVRLENDGGSWQGSYVAASDFRNPAQVNVVLTGHDGYDGYSAILSYTRDPFARPAGCQRLWGLISERPLPPAPAAYVTGGVEPPPMNAIELSLTDTGIKPTDLRVLWADEDEHTLIVTNAGSIEHGLAIEDEWPPEIVAGSEDDLLEPGETRDVRFFFEPGKTYTIYDPVERAGSAIEVQVVLPDE